MPDPFEVLSHAKEEVTKCSGSAVRLWKIGDLL